MKKSDELMIFINSFVKDVVEDNPKQKGSRKSFNEHDLFISDELRMIYCYAEALQKHIIKLESQLEENV